MNGERNLTKQLCDPKEVQLTQFIDDCKEWWHHTHPKMFKSKPEYYRDRQAVC